MDDSTIMWIVVAVVGAVLLALLVWFLVRTSRTAKAKRREADQAKAAELRRDAERERIAVQEREASAEKLDAEARLQQAEADRKAAEAARLQQEAQDRDAMVGESRADVDERLRRADELDPEHRATTTGTVRITDDDEGHQPEHRADAPPDTHGARDDREGRHQA
jgi:flagellar biosynthesis/type III secretory pathway M-ring protein FliF/YscJ